MISNRLIHFLSLYDARASPDSYNQQGDYGTAAPESGFFGMDVWGAPSVTTWNSYPLITYQERYVVVTFSAHLTIVRMNQHSVY